MFYFLFYYVILFIFPIRNYIAIFCEMCYHTYIFEIIVIYHFVILILWW